MENEIIMISKPKVSIIVPVYKVEAFLDRCIQSLRTQSLSDIEIILVDDGSPDKCPEMCDTYALNDARIKVVHKHNAGLGMACNTGIEVAEAEFVAFCDSDDWVDSDMYMTLYKAAINYDADIVYSGIRRVDQYGQASNVAVSHDFNLYKNKSAIENFALDMIANAPSVAVERRVPMSAKIVLYRRALLEDNNIRFESERKLMSEDLFFNLDCLTHAKRVVEIPQIFYNYYANPQSLTGVVRLDRFESTRRMYDELMSRYTFSSSDYAIRVMRFFIGYGRRAIRQIAKSKVSHRTKTKLIKSICNDTIWEDIRSTYPMSLMPFKHRIVLALINLKSPILLNLLTKFS